MKIKKDQNGNVHTTTQLAAQKKNVNFKLAPQPSACFGLQIIKKLNQKTILPVKQLKGKEYKFISP